MVASPNMQKNRDVHILFGILPLNFIGLPLWRNVHFARSTPVRADDNDGVKRLLTQAMFINQVNDR